MILHKRNSDFHYFTGIYVKHSGERDGKTRLIIANAVSIFDSLALNVSTTSISVSLSGLYIVPF